ncbi:hypothetical protein H9Q10_08875 [Eikenella sp. S3360]|uniref:Uncharacterized protein n=1 Tax=Eikenella glucosivorans TaxID=2766967 RepID=A0ABS0NBZ1_9NEIS|nr:hypothetical protein [Eikenella glucosivorans]MBH5329780.1 hypothetical protein [Eikenella glucosivorans]
MQKFTVLALAALIAAPALAIDKDGWLAEAQQFNTSAVRSKDSGARQTNLFNGRAKTGEQKTHQVQLTAGKYYSFFADCDRECDNIDLTLKSANGQVIQADTEGDDSPMFGWRANRSGRYTLTVTIPGCNNSSAGCDYSSQVFMGNRTVFGTAD